MPALYDLILMLDTAAPDDRRAKILSDVEAAISAGGSIESKHDWGPRTLAYEIDKRTDADYHLLQFTGGRELLERLQRSLRIADGVLRFRIVKLAPGTPPPPQLRAERPAEAPSAAEPPDATAGADAVAEPEAPARSEAEATRPATAPDEPVAGPAEPASEPAAS